MAQTILIKRASSGGTATPGSLSQGELAYSAQSNKLFIGRPGTGTVDHIGGKVFMDMLDHTAGVLTASSAIVVDSNSKVDQLLVDNMRIGTTANTIDTSSGTLTLAPTGNLIITHGGTVDLSGQANEITIPDNQASALEIKEGSTSYLKVTTTNSSEKIIAGKTFIADGDGTTSNGGISLSNGLVDIKNGGSASKIQMYCEFSNAHYQTIQAAPHSSSASNTLVLPATGTIFATQDGTETLTNKTLTSPDINTPDIDGGTVDGSTINNSAIGGSTPAAGAFTQVTVDQLFFNGRTISSIDSNGNINLSPNGSGVVDVNTSRITNVVDPTGAQDAATKAYVDAVKQALDIKDAVRAGSTGNGTLASAYANGQTLDGVTLATGDRILLKDQTTASENGIYTVNASGAPTRAIDANSSADVTQGMFVFVAEGTANAGNGFVLTTSGTITLGSTNLAFTQFSGAGTITAGAGLGASGANIFNVNVDDKTIEVSSDALRLKGVTTTAVGDLLIGVAADGGYSRLVKPSGNATAHDYILSMNTSGAAQWSNSIDGGTF
jgi:hypothetical protein